MPSGNETRQAGFLQGGLEGIEKEKRAARMLLRTGWRTDATEKDKETALRVAINKMGGGKKYSWLQQGPETVADTLGQDRARELGIKTGKLAKELKIGEYSVAPQHLTFNWEDLRSGGINMSREELEKCMRDAGVPEDEIHATLAPTPAKIIGRSAASVRTHSGAPASEEVAPTASTKTRGKKRKVSADDNGETTTTMPANKKSKHEKESTSTTALASEKDAPNKSTKTRGKKRGVSAVDGTETSTTTRASKKEKRKETASVAALATPPKSSSPEALGSSPAAAIEIDIDDGPTFAPPSPSLSVLEDCLEEEIGEDDKPTLAPPPPPTLSDRENCLEEEIGEDEKSTLAPPSPTWSELETSLEVGIEDDDKPTLAPPAPTLSERETCLDEEIEEDEKPAFAPPSPTLSQLGNYLDEEIGEDGGSKFPPPSPTLSEMEACLLEEEGEKGGAGLS